MIICPAVPLRLSVDQLEPIFIGLDDLVQEAAYVRATGSLRRYPMLEKHMRFNCWEAPTPEQMSAIATAHAKVQTARQRSGRLKLDHRELAACILAVSHAKRLVGKKQAKTWTNNYRKAAKRLKETLENARKRALRTVPLCQRRGSRDGIVADLAVVRQLLLPTVVQRKQAPFERALARELINEAEKLARVGLGMKGYEVPPECKSLRQLVRERLTLAARRGTTRLDFLEDKIGAGLLLADYIIAHCDTLVRRRPTEKGVGRTRSTGASEASNVPSPPSKNCPPPPNLKKEPPHAVRMARERLDSLLFELCNGISDWSRMTRFQQANAIAEIKTISKVKKENISNREIARRLGVDEGTVRRMLKEAQLPKEVRTQIARGKSFNRALKEQKDPVYQQNRRLQREKVDGSISDELAKKVLVFVRDQFRWPSYARQAVQSARDLAPPRGLGSILPRADVDALMAKAKQGKIAGRVNEIQLGFQRLLWWLLRAAPERAIHIAALNKALLAIPKGAAPWDTVV